MRLLHFHGRGLWPQPRPRRRPDQGLRAEPLRLDYDDEPPDRGPPSSTPASRRWLSIQGRRSSGTSPPPPTSAPPTSTAASASPAPPTASASATRSASSRPLRPDRQPLPLVRRHPRQPR